MTELKQYKKRKEEILIFKMDKWKKRNLKKN